MAVEHFPGTPCWLDLACPDPAAAAAFYGAVLGWRCLDKGPEHGHYRTCWVGPEEVAGIMAAAPGQRPAWTVYLAVEDLDLDLRALTRRGAQVVAGPHEVGELGRMAVVVGPTGALTGLWQAGSFGGFTAMGVPGAPAWFEVNTRQAEALSATYAELFALEREKLEGMEYWTLHAGGAARYGVLQMDAAWEGMEPHWMAYFAVASADAACDTVREHGGQVHYGPFDTPYGRIAICSDPHGAHFTLMTPGVPA